MEDVELVLTHPTREGISRLTDFPVVWGYTRDDRYVIVAYEAPYGESEGLRSPATRLVEPSLVALDVERPVLVEVPAEVDGPELEHRLC
jgi:hypothetical protein